MVRLKMVRLNVIRLIVVRQNDVRLNVFRLNPLPCQIHNMRYGTVRIIPSVTNGK